MGLVLSPIGGFLFYRTSVRVVLNIGLLVCYSISEREVRPMNEIEMLIAYLKNHPDQIETALAVAREFVRQDRDENCKGRSALEGQHLPCG